MMIMMVRKDDDGDCGGGQAGGKAGSTQELILRLK